MNRIYFAHQQNLYGKPIENQIIAKIRLVYRLNGFDPTVVNPGDYSEVYSKLKHEHTTLGEPNNIDFFLGICATCESCVFTTFKNGSIGAGVGKEVQSFLSRNCVARVYDWDKQYFRALDSLNGFQILTIGETRERLQIETWTKEAFNIE